MGRLVSVPDRRRRRSDCAMSKLDDPRARELGHLKVALATFALHLDAFEMQAQDVMISIARQRDRAPPVEIGRNPRKEELSGGQ